MRSEETTDKVKQRDTAKNKEKSISKEERIRRGKRENGRRSVQKSRSTGQ
jgi:hypothetical protein